MTTKPATKNYVLDQYEQEIEDAARKGKIGHYSKKEHGALSAQLKEAAQNTIARLSKNKNITFRANSADIERLRAIAAEEGLPYQTLLSSVLHKYVSGRLMETKR